MQGVFSEGLCSNTVIFYVFFPYAIGTICYYIDFTHAIALRYLMINRNDHPENQ